MLTHLCIQFRGISITTALGNTALKIGSKCSFTPVDCAFSPIFALSCLRSLRSAEVSLDKKASLNKTGWLLFYCRAI